MFLFLFLMLLRPRFWLFLAQLAFELFDFLKNGQADGRKWFPNFMSLWTYVQLRWRFGEMASTARSGGAVDQPPSSLTTESEWAFERRHDFAASEYIFFFGVDKSGNHFFIRLKRGDAAVYTVTLLVKIDDDCYTPVTQPIVTINVNGDDNSVYTAEGLRLEVRDAFRKWRISYDGVLGSTNNDRRHFVSMRAWWASVTDPLNESDLITAGNVANNVAFNRWCTNDLSEVDGIFHGLITTNRIAQHGQITAQITIGDQETKEFIFRGRRQKSFGETTSSKQSSTDEIVINFQNGVAVGVTSCGYFGDSLTVCRGYVNYTMNRKHSAIRPSIDIETCMAESSQDFLLTLDDGRELSIVQLPAAYATTVDDCVHAERTRVVFREYLLDDDVVGHGLMISVRPFVAPIIDLPEPPSTAAKATRSDKLLRSVSFLLDACQDGSLTGGKAANLARLTRMQHGFVVPRGIALTTTAYKQHIAACGERMSLEINSLQTPGRMSTAEVDSSCQRVANMITEQPFSMELQQEIAESLKLAVGDKWCQKGVAVRSSAVGEDGNELSSAGQLETYLEVCDLDEIYEKVKLCWASNFRKEVTSYRRQYGQHLTPPVGVVIQEMITGGISGVMFSQDPVSGRPDRIVLNAFIGLGEAVVSGAVTPDTAVLSKDGDVDDNERISILSSEGCLRDVPTSMLLRLGACGRRLERLFGQPQDIEWSYIGDTIYILQTRPITSLDLESEWELLHEFDSGLPTDREALTIHNVGEVMPKGITPFGRHLIKALDQAVMESMLRFDSEANTRHVPVALATYRNRILFNMTNTMLRHKDFTEFAMAQIAFAGSAFVTAEMVEAARPRMLTIGYRQKFSVFIEFIFRGKPYHHRAADLVDEMSRIDGEHTASMSTLMRNFQKHIVHYTQIVYAHAKTSERASISYSIIGSFLGAKLLTAVSPEFIQDIATLYSVSAHNNMVSADAPAALTKLARQIIECKQRSLFLSFTDEQALKWLLSAESTSCGVAFDEFLQMHGHRGLAELDIGMPSWSERPLQLMSMLRGLLVNETALMTDRSSCSSIGEALDKLNYPVTRVSRYSLEHYVVPFARKAVASREMAKSYAVKSTRILRRLMLRIGDTLHKQGYLPDSELVFFMTFAEICRLIQGRSARIVGRATRRRKIMKLQDACDYPVFCIGDPKPIEQSTLEELIATLELSGTAVCQGRVVGNARVALTLEDASATEPGEILITHSTDIAWSPYFPIIAGIVTEIGGLISHGAVVAREYGLPSLIAVPNATKVFATGDRVLLDSRKGIIMKIKNEQS